MAMNSSPNKTDHNGYSFDFVGRIPDELVCKLCSKVLRDPRQVVCCGQHYCQGCIEQRIQSKSCPSCHTVNFDHFRDRHFEQRISALKIHCPHYKRGCKWTGDLCNIKPHLNSPQGCAYEGVKCPSKCGQLMPRKDIKEHVAKQCPNRMVRCQYCNHENTFQVIAGSHSSVCPNYPVKCPYNCGNRNIRRAELSKHEHQCTLRPVVCPFQSAGCKVPLVQKDLNDHMSTYTAHHLELVTKAFDSLRTRAETAEKELHAARTEIEDIRRKEEVSRRAVDVKLKAIVMNADELAGTCNDAQKFAVQSIRSLIDETFYLKKIGQPITFQMINYSDYKRSGKVWYSPPFYVADGYKMCLAVYAGGIGIGRGSCLSIALCLMKGEFDDELTWPVDLPFHLIVEVVRQNEAPESGRSSTPSNPKTYMYFHPDKPQGRVQEGVLLEARQCENFVRHDVVEDWMLFYDAVTFQIVAESEFL